MLPSARCSAQSPGTACTTPSKLLKTARGGVVVAVVTDGDEPRRRELPGLRCSGLDPLPGEIHDTRVPAERESRGGRVTGAVDDRSREPHGLGRAQRVDAGEPAVREESVFDRRAPHCPRAVDAPQRAEVVRMTVAYPAVQRREDAACNGISGDCEIRDALGVDRAADGITVDRAGGEEHHRATQEQRGVRRVQAAGVRHRRGRQPHRCRTGDTCLDRVAHHGVEGLGHAPAVRGRRVGEGPFDQRALVPEHALRSTGRATREPEQELLAVWGHVGERLVRAHEVCVPDGTADRRTRGAPVRGLPVVDLDSAR